MEAKAEEDPNYTDSLNNRVTKKESPTTELIRKTDDREDWKAMITGVCMQQTWHMMMIMMMNTFTPLW